LSSLEAGAPRGVDVLSTAYRVASRDGTSIGEADSIDGIIEIVKNAEPGRHRIYKDSLDPDTGDLQSWDWGTISKSRKGSITLALTP
jgi:hypothetical protein